MDHREEFLDEMRGRLLERREALTRLADTASDATATVELDQTRIGRLSRMDAMQSQAMARELVRRNRRERTAIDGALERIANGEYGICRGCEEEIPEGRLRANPSTPLCVGCAEDGGRR